METFNEYQYNDFLNRSEDIYADAKYKIILDFLKNKNNLKILNAGCGSGELSFLLAQVGHQVVGIDPSEEYINLAKKNLPSQLAGLCAFEVKAIENLSTGEEYDCVIALDVLEHIKNDAGALKKLVKALRLGGDLMIVVPALPFLFGFHDEQLKHYRRYTRSSLIRLIKSVVFAALGIKKLRYFGFTLVPICFLYSKIWRRPYPIAVGKTSIFSFVKPFILKTILLFDKFCPLPIGISLIGVFHKEALKNIDKH